MSLEHLEKFFENAIKESKEEDILFSLHMKATMMKVSDPIIFGKCVEVFYAEVFKSFKKELDAVE